MLPDSIVDTVMKPITGLDVLTEDTNEDEKVKKMLKMR